MVPRATSQEPDRQAYAGQDLPSDLDYKDQGRDLEEVLGRATTQEPSRAQGHRGSDEAIVSNARSLGGGFVNEDGETHFSTGGHKKPAGNIRALSIHTGDIPSSSDVDSGSD